MNIELESVIYTKKDYRQFVIFSVFKRILIISVLAIVVSILLSVFNGVIDISRLAPRGALVYLIAFMMYFFLLFPLLLSISYLVNRYLWNQKTARMLMSSPRTFHLTREKFSGQSSNSKFETNWHSLEKIKIHKKFLILYINSSAAHFLPWRLFTVEEKKELIAFLKSEVSRNSKSRNRQQEKHQ